MKVMVTGGRGMLGRALGRAAEAVEDEYVLTGRLDADLTDAAAVDRLVSSIKPDLIVHAAAKVGGIAANMADQSGFLRENLLIDSHVLGAAREHGVGRLVYIGSSCMYPKDYRQPLVESDVLAAPLEPTNEGYAIAKIAGARYTQFASQEAGLNWRVVIPSNLYGPDDDYSPIRGHLVAAALRKAHEAKQSESPWIDVWGDGAARREFTFVGDVAEWLVRCVGGMHQWPSIMNIGYGLDHSVLDYYRAALDVVGVEAELRTDPSKPAGMRQKLMDSSVARGFGWEPRTGLIEGMTAAYARFVQTERERVAL